MILLLGRVGLEATAGFEPVNKGFRPVRRPPRQPATAPNSSHAIAPSVEPPHSTPSSEPRIRSSAARCSGASSSSAALTSNQQRLAMRRIVDRRVRNFREGPPATPPRSRVWLAMKTKASLTGAGDPQSACTRLDVAVGARTNQPQARSRVPSTSLGRAGFRALPAPLSVSHSARPGVTDL